MEGIPRGAALRRCDSSPGSPVHSCCCESGGELERPRCPPWKRPRCLAGTPDPVCTCRPCLQRAQSRCLQGCLRRCKAIAAALHSVAWLRLVPDRLGRCPCSRRCCWREVDSGWIPRTGHGQGRRWQLAGGFCRAAAPLNFLKGCRAAAPLNFLEGCRRPRQIQHGGPNRRGSEGCVSRPRPPCHRGRGLRTGLASRQRGTRHRCRRLRYRPPSFDRCRVGCRRTTRLVTALQGCPHRHWRGRAVAKDWRGWRVHRRHSLRYQGSRLRRCQPRRRGRRLRGRWRW